MAAKSKGKESQKSSDSDSSFEDLSDSSSSSGSEIGDDDETGGATAFQIIPKVSNSQISRMIEDQKRIIAEQKSILQRTKQLLKMKTSSAQQCCRSSYDIGCRS